MLQRFLAQADRSRVLADHRHRLVRAAADHREAERDPHDERPRRLLDLLQASDPHARHFHGLCDFVRNRLLCTDYGTNVL